MGHQHKVVLITGGAKRVGAAIARSLHARGFSVMIHYRHSQTEAETLSAILNTIRPNSAATVQADLLDTVQTCDLINATLQQFGRLDALINNASSYYPTALGQINESHWNDLMGSNLKAPIFLSQMAAPHLKQQNGCIINITDTHIKRPKKDYMLYSIAKAGLVTLTRALACELAPDVRVNAVAPGPVLWPEDNPQFDEAYQELVVSQTLLKRIGAPEDIAKTVGFLIEEATYITGAIIPVDGGRSLNF